jgi:hypothetical protein
MNGFLLSSYSHKSHAKLASPMSTSASRYLSSIVKTIQNKGLILLFETTLSLSLSHTHTHTRVHTQNLLLQLSSEEIEGIFLIYVPFSGYNYGVYICVTSLC